MVKVNFDQIKEPKGIIPPGIYEAEIDKIEEMSTRYGDPLWCLQLKITEPCAHRGRVVYDNLVFSRKGLPRVKLVLKRLGVNVSGEREVEAPDLLGRQCTIQVEVSGYYSERLRKHLQKNSVAYEGYLANSGPSPATTRQEALEMEEEEVPF